MCLLFILLIHVYTIYNIGRVEDCSIVQKSWPSTSRWGRAVKRWMGKSLYLELGEGDLSVMRLMCVIFVDWRFQLMVNWLFGLVVWNSWDPPMKGIVTWGYPLESQTTNPNQQLAIRWTFDVFMFFFVVEDISDCQVQVVTFGSFPDDFCDQNTVESVVPFLPWLSEKWVISKVVTFQTRPFSTFHDYGRKSSFWGSSGNDGFEIKPQQKDLPGWWTDDTPPPL